MACRIINASPALRDEAVITQSRIAFPAFNATIQAIASDAGSAAGSNAVVAGFDELWAYTSERSRRLWDEMTPPPTRQIAFRLTVTYAGYEGESTLLEELYRRGLQQPQIGEDLYAGDGLLMFWSHKPVAPWQDEDWLISMRRERASAYARQVLNEFASSSSQFVDLNKWDRCVDQSSGRLSADLFLPVFIGVDASFKHDSTAIAAVAFDSARQQVRLVTHRIFQPTSNEPLDFEITIEAYLLDLNRRFQVQQILFDPWQMQSVAQRLQKQNLPIEEFPQSSPNLTAASQNLFDLIESQGLILYPDQAMRLAVSRAIAIETPRGWRIGKDKGSHKIDIVVALGMACLAAVKAQGGSNYDRSYRWVDGVPIGGVETAEQRRARQKEESDDWYAARLRGYLAMHGAFGWPPFP
jgi:phage terminase large subunit-like protein